ncbi:DUF1972 domain-containing protein [Citrobacter freundii]|uniref:DUF1972 domain-containing protein n=1 Tax=Citrobacter freundii TaxID=546 RepID=UPI002E160CF0
MPFKANGVQSIIYDIFSMIYSIFLKPDVVLILGVSGCIFLPFLSLFTKAKIITNIDGLEWRRAKWSWPVKRFLKLSERIAVNFSDLIITDNQAIFEYVSKEYKKDSIVIAYGGDHAWVKPVNDIKHVGSGCDYYLSLCRIEPENNVEMILESFKESGFRLKFVGNWNNSDFGKKMLLSYKDVKNIELIEPVYNLNELFILRNNCKGYIHGHSAGGTNPSLVEAMHFSKPIFAFDCDFNRYTTEDSAYYFDSTKSLHRCIALFEKLPSDNSGDVMKMIANRKYTWNIIAKMYERCY